MIDKKTLAEDEAELTRLQHQYRAQPDMTECFANRAEIIRLARRYLALRNEAKTEEGRIRVQAIFWNMGSREELDAAADRMIQEMVK